MAAARRNPGLPRGSGTGVPRGDRMSTAAVVPLQPERCHAAGVAGLGLPQSLQDGVATLYCIAGAAGGYYDRFSSTAAT